MGEAKRRALLDPTFGQNPIEKIATQLQSALASFQSQMGRGFFVTSDDRSDSWMVYIRESELDNHEALKAILRESEHAILGRLLGMLQGYDMAKFGIHLHFSDEDDISLEQFPLSLMDGEGAFDRSAIAIAQRFLNMGGAKVMEVPNG